MIRTSKKIKKLAFFGDGKTGEDSDCFKLAYETAKIVAKDGYIVVNGGGPGVMLASSLGAKEVGGKVEVVVVKSASQPKGNYEGQSEENVRLADKIYEEANYMERMNKLAEVADAFLIFKGGTGTIAELGYVWSVAKFEHGNHEPVIMVGKGWRGVMNKLNRFLKLEKIEMDVINFANNGNDVVKIVKKITG